MTRPLVAAFALALLSAGCAARTSRATLNEPSRPPLPIEQLQLDLRTFFTALPIDHAHWSVKVQSLVHGDTLYSYNAFRFMVPASNQKVLTTAVAAERLGWDYQFTTRLLATGPVDPDGILNGDLVVVGNGDPSINPRHPARWRAFDDWGAALRAKGIRAINGRIIGDDNAFEEPGWGLGWAWDDLQYGYGAAAAALQYNENQIEVMVGPGLEPGTAAVLATAPFGHGLHVVSDVTTVAADNETRVGISRLPASARLEVHGQIAAGSKPVTMTAAVANPTILYINALRDALARQGVYVSAPPTDIDDVRPAPVLASATEVLVDRSPPLSELIDVTLKWSRNEYAETLLRAMAPAGKPATDAGGLQVMREQLRTWGVLPESYLARDGSGLSRMDYVSAEALTNLLTYLWMDPKHADAYRAALPVAGVSGTLAERFKETPAQNRVWAKTGTLSNVRGISGYVVTSAAEPLVFSILVNNFRLPAAEVDATIDKAVIRLVEFRR
jgi:D-alanyl-D-alanine carboxypeptidase/D-alanyl-D-alanine-endopeptidase (penicillin-binding protein 4)